MNNNDNIFGDVISSYSRTQALEDGVLVDLSALAPEVCRQHFKFPIACTSAVWDIIDRACENKNAMNDLNGVVHDILFMSKSRLAKEVNRSTRRFQTIISGAGRQKTFDFKLACGPGDDAEPVLTLMLADED